MYLTSQKHSSAGPPIGSNWSNWLTAGPDRDSPDDVVELYISVCLLVVDVQVDALQHHAHVFVLHGRRQVAVVGARAHAHVLGDGHRDAAQCQCHCQRRGAHLACLKFNSDRFPRRTSI